MLTRNIVYIQKLCRVTSTQVFGALVDWKVTQLTARVFSHLVNEGRSSDKVATIVSLLWKKTSSTVSVVDNDWEKKDRPLRAIPHSSVGRNGTVAVGVRAASAVCHIGQTGP
jgi:hypothetical protein